MTGEFLRLGGIQILLNFGFIDCFQIYLKREGSGFLTDRFTIYKRFFILEYLKWLWSCTKKPPAT